MLAKGRDRMRMNSRLATGLVAALLFASPLHAQQSEPSLPEQLIEGVRSLFERIFRADPASPPAESQPAAQPPVQPAPAQAQPPAEAPVAASAPVSQPMQGPARSLHE